MIIGALKGVQTDMIWALHMLRFLHAAYLHLFCLLTHIISLYDDLNDEIIPLFLLFISMVRFMDRKMWSRGQQ